MTFGFCHSDTEKTEQQVPPEAVFGMKEKESEPVYELGLEHMEHEPDYLSEYVLDFGEPEVDIEYDESDVSFDWTIHRRW